MTAAESLLETLLWLLTCSVSFITSAHPSPLRFLLLLPVLWQEGCLATSTHMPVVQLHRGDLAFGTKAGRVWARGCEQGMCTDGQRNGGRGMLRGKRPGGWGWMKNVKPWSRINGMALKGTGFGGKRSKGTNSRWKEAGSVCLRERARGG